MRTINRIPAGMLEFYIVEAMIEYGGSFVSTLGTLFRRADGTNQEKLRVAFKNYFDDYKTKGIEMYFKEYPNS